MGISLIEGEAVTDQLINKVHLKMVGDWWSVSRCSWCHDLEGRVGYLGRVGWIRGKLMGRGGNVCKRQILQISVLVGEESQYAKKTKPINN